MIKKNFLFSLLSIVLLNTSCQNNVTNSTVNNSNKSSDTKKDPEVKQTNLVKIEEKSLLKIINFDLDNFPAPSTEKNDAESKKVEDYIKTNDVFSKVPYVMPDKYNTNFTGDGAPIFGLTGDGAPIFGLTGDGAPIFGIKAAQATGSYLWTRTPNETLLDYLQLNSIAQRKWGITTYANYSQLIDYTISVSGSITNTKHVNLIKQVSFGLVQDTNGYKLYSVSPLSIRRVEPKSFKYQIRSVTFSSNNNKIIISGDGKLIPMPGISVSKHIGNNKFKVFVEVVFSQLARPKDFAAVLGIDGKQYQMQNVMGNIYGADIEVGQIKDTTGLGIELIDKDSLEKNDDYQGDTWILPMTN